jgi:hypothetical protein
MDSGVKGGERHRESRYASESEAGSDLGDYTVEAQGIATHLYPFNETVRRSGVLLRA